MTDCLVIVLSNQVFLLAIDLNRPREALPLVEEVYTLASKHILTGLIGQIKHIRDQILAMIRKTE